MVSEMISSSGYLPGYLNVPQGSVLGPIFLIFINDLPDGINSTWDDCVLYRNIRRSKDQQILQDLDKLALWEETWLMEFNAAKCHSMRGTPPPKEIIHGYTLHNQVLENVSSAKYLGVKITYDLEWGQHINEITSKDIKTLFVETWLLHRRKPRPLRTKLLSDPNLNMQRQFGCPITK